MKEDYPLGAIADFLEQLPNDEYEHKRIGKMIRALEAAVARLAQLESVLAEAEARVEKLKDIAAIQCSDGNWNANPYMQGMANGLLMALSIFDDQEPAFKEAPEQFLDERPAASVSNQIAALKEKSDEA